MEPPLNTYHHARTALIKIATTLHIFDEQVTLSPDEHHLVDIALSAANELAEILTANADRLTNPTERSNLAN